ncbi:MAG: acyltransferase [Deltaproteobacteria bacterium]|nr:acyltransferase [Deltaproteobacteria bacterium]
MKQGAYRPDIDGLRALAVLSVVVYHAFPAVLQGGFIGVDVFFVISGYLISGIILNDLQQGTFSLRNFYSRRIRRIFPALIIVLAAVLIFGWFALFPAEYRSLGEHVFGGAVFISNFLLWHEAGYFDAVAKSKPLLHLWSLGIEEQFYIFFPLFLWYCAKKRFRAGRIIAALCALSFLLNVFCMHDLSMIFYSPYTRIWELLAGAALRMAMRQPPAGGRFLKPNAPADVATVGQEGGHDGRGLGLVPALSGIILLGLAFLLVREGEPYPGWKALLPVFGTMLLIAAGPLNPVNKHLLANRLAVFTGLVSYPFYLWHWSLISCAYIINGGLGPDTWLLRIELVAASFILAVLTYFLVEKPIRFSAWARSGKIIALVTGMVMIGATGLSVCLRDGLPDREHLKESAAIARQLEKLELGDKAGIAYTGMKKGTLGYYRYTDVGADETVALIGDSHALAAYWGIAELGRELGYNTVVLGRTVPAGDQWVQTPAAQIAAVFELLKKKHDIRKVFICVRGMIYITGTRYFPEKVSPAGEEDEERSSEGYNAFKESLQAYVDTLREYGKDVFLIAEIPELPDTPRDYISRPLKTAKNKAFPTVHKADVLKRQEQYLRLLSEIRNATVIDTIGPMCPDGACLVFTENGLPLYSDDNHLTLIGSEFQAKRILRPYLTGRKGE